MDWLFQTLYLAQEEKKQNMTESAFAEWKKKSLPEIAAKVIGKLQTDYKGARDLVQKQADMQKAFFRSQKDTPGATKADVLKEIWAELPKVTDKPVPPLDEEMLAELPKVTDKPVP